MIRSAFNGYGRPLHPRVGAGIVSIQTAAGALQRQATDGVYESIDGGAGDLGGRDRVGRAFFPHANVLTESRSYDQRQHPGNENAPHAISIVLGLRQGAGQLTHTLADRSFLERTKPE